MNVQENSHSLLMHLGMIYGGFYIITGILGIILLILGPPEIFIDPIEQIILVLVGIIFLRSYVILKSQNNTGIAFLFVGTIIGIVLGSISFLKFLFMGLIGGLIEESIYSNFLSRITFYFANPSLILGIMAFIPHKLIKKTKVIN